MRTWWFGHAKTRPIGRRLLAIAGCLTLAGSGPAGGIEFGGEETTFAISGFLSTGSALRLAGTDKFRIGWSEVKPEALVAQINKARIALDASFPNEIRSLVTVDLTYTSAPGRPFGERAEVRLDEAYLDFRLWEVDFRAGLQKVIWGKSDQISPFDMLTARDFIDPFVAPTLEDRIAQAGLRVNYAWGDYGLEGVLFPIWLRSRVPQAETDANGDTRVDEWFPPMAIYGSEYAWGYDAYGQPIWAIFLAQYDPLAKPQKDLSTITGGVKLNMLKGNFDIDLYLLTTMDPMPTAEVNTLLYFGSLPEIGLYDDGVLTYIDGHCEFRRITTGGVAAASTLGPVALRSEVAVTGGKQYFRLLESLEEAILEAAYYGYGEARGKPKSHAELAWINGMDYEIPNVQIFTSTQLALTQRFSHEDYYVQGATDLNCSFLLRRSFYDDHMAVSLGGLAQFMAGSVWIGPSFSYTPPVYEDIQLGARLNLFLGDESSMVGMYRDHSSLLFTVRWLF